MSDQNEQPNPEAVTPEPEQPKADMSPNEADPAVDSAVDDIVRKEGDDELKAQDEAVEQAVVMKQSRRERFKQFLRNWWNSPRKRWGTIGVLVVVLAVVFALPITRYNVLGLVLRTSVTVDVVDSKTGAPVSGATVELSGKEAETQADGKATLRVNMGSGKLAVSKKYYTGYSHSELVKSGGNSFKATLVATGRQVKVKVVNKITGKPVANAKVAAGGATAKTDKNGMANVVLSSGATTVQASVSLSGYNTGKVMVDANSALAQNTFSITPAGKLYFLSNLSGTIDLVKTNLDGTDRQTVLAGTGNEDPHDTSLLASRDWKYLALLSKRSGNSASLYLIDTTNGDKLTTIDQGTAQFSLVGWSGDRFVYEVDRSATVQDWQTGQVALKSFDPTTGQTLLLDQTQASGTGQSDWLGQVFGQVYLMGSQVVYSKGWNASFTDMPQLNSKQAELDTISADGSSHRTIKTFSVGSGTQTSYIAIGTTLYEPNGLYLNWSLGDGGDQFYTYGNGKVAQDASMTQDEYDNATYSTYLLSPSGNNTFWADQRDGKNTLFTGDENGDNQKQIASLSDYSPYGWSTDNYLLVSKSSSELYIMPAAGGTPLKITDYYKPPINYNGYGGGYGGL